ncbi:MAG: hypothetical protein U0359_27815 [Byssovorax sp.]
MPPARRLLPLASSLALLGAAASFFGQGALRPRGMEPGPEEHALAAAGASALIFAAASLFLAPSPAAEEWMPARPSRGRIALVTGAAGLVAGLAASAIAPSPFDLRAPLGVLLGALLLVPAIAIAIQAARRSDEARPGSIIARAELRAELTVIAAGAGALSALALPDWIASSAGLASPPWEVFPLLAVTASAVALVLLVDRLAARRVDRLARALDDLDQPGSPAIEASRPLGRIDFGLGGEARARALPRTTYRGGGLPETLLLGDVDRARETLRRAAIRGVLALGLLEIVAIGHDLARDPEGAAAYQAELCEAGAKASCRRAALLAERAGRPLEASSHLHELACAAGNEPSCLAVTLLHRRMAALE